MSESPGFDLLTQLLAACRCEVSVTVNAHRNYYESVADYLNRPDHADVLSDNVRAEMIARDTIVEVQAYPDTPIGFHKSVHWDVVSALQEVLKSVSEIV